MTLDLRPLGDRAFLARFATEDAARVWASTVRNRRFEGIDDVVLAYRSTAVFADPTRCDLDALERALRDLDRLGQLRPGDDLRFRRTALDEARRLDRADRTARERRLGQISALARDLFEPEWRTVETPG